MKVRATAKTIRVSPRKIRLVVDAVRGLPVERAEQVLRMMAKRGAEPALKVLQSAVANAVHNFKLDKKDLVVSEFFANEGVVMKRYRARAFGRAATIRKRTSHLIVVVEGKGAPGKTAATPGAKKARVEKASAPKTDAAKPTKKIQ